MKTTTFTIYKDSLGFFRAENYTATMQNHDWTQFLKETNPAQLERWLAMSSRKRSPKVCRLYKTESFKNWQKGKDIVVTSKPFAVATANHDGRVPEWGIKHAILEAVKYNESEARYYPSSNANKQAHQRLVYVFAYNLQLIKQI